MTKATNPGWRIAVLLLAAVAIAALMALPPRPAYGHADHSSSSPSPNAVLDTPPQQVAVWFTEPVEPSLSSLSVFDARGARVDRGESIPNVDDPAAISIRLSPLANGTYTVAWRNVSTVDGHLRRGSFLFSVGEEVSGEVSEEPQRLPPAEPVLRMLVLLGILAMAGGTVFWLLVARPTLSALPSDDAHGALARNIDSRSRRLIALAVGVFGVASMAHLVLQATIIHEVSPAGALGQPLWTTLAETGWGRLWGWRMALAAAFAAVLFTSRAP